MKKSILDNILVSYLQDREENQDILFVASIPEGSI